MASRKLKVVIDDRTSKLDNQSLDCRGFNHLWRRQPQTPSQAADLSRRGLKEIIRVCAGGCGGRWEQVFSRTNGTAISDKRVYDNKDYLLPPGSGRLSKDDARVALFAREDSDLYAKR